MNSSLVAGKCTFIAWRSCWVCGAESWYELCPDKNLFLGCVKAGFAFLWLVLWSTFWLQSSEKSHLVEWGQQQTAAESSLTGWSFYSGGPLCGTAQTPITLSREGKQISVHVEKSHVQIKTQRLPATKCLEVQSCSSGLDNWCVVNLTPCQVNIFWMTFAFGFLFALVTVLFSHVTQVDIYTGL